MEEYDEKIKNFIAEVLQKMSITFDDVLLDEDTLGQRRFIVKTKDSNLLIGPKGEGFLALNHLIKKIFFKNESEESVKFSIDINDYQESSIKHVINKAKILSERVKFFKTNAEMEPMSSYERMVVHTLFQDDPDIKTESEGYGKSRRVIIKFSKKDTD